METLRFWYIFHPVPDFEFDPDKSAANLAKHGIDFVTAQALWADDPVRVPSNQNADEDRELAIGCIEGRIWTAIITHRDGRIRIISVRRARPDEERVYERSRGETH